LEGGRLIRSLSETAGCVPASKEEKGGFNV
jgi:hypothetical protein